MDAPTIYKRTIDTRYRCVVRLTSGRSCHRSTCCRDRESAAEFARLLQRDIQRRAALGDLLPPPRANDPRI